MSRPSTATWTSCRPPLLTGRRDEGGDVAPATPSYHAAAISGHLEQVPAGQLVFENLSIPSKTGFTPAHAAAETGQLGKIPARQLTTPSSCTTRNDNGDTPAARRRLRGPPGPGPRRRPHPGGHGHAQLRRHLGRVAGGRARLHRAGPRGGEAQVLRPGLAAPAQAEPDALAVLGGRPPAPGGRGSIGPDCALLDFSPAPVATYDLPSLFRLPSYEHIHRLHHSARDHRFPRKSDRRGRRTARLRRLRPRGGPVRRLDRRARGHRASRRRQEALRRARASRRPSRT